MARKVTFVEMLRKPLRYGSVFVVAINGDDAASFQSEHKASEFITGIIFRAWERNELVISSDDPDAPECPYCGHKLGSNEWDSEPGAEGYFSAHTFCSWECDEQDGTHYVTSYYDGKPWGKTSWFTNLKAATAKAGDLARSNSPRSDFRVYDREHDSPRAEYAGSCYFALPMPRAWESRERYEERNGFKLSPARWKELIAHTAKIKNATGGRFS